MPDKIVKSVKRVFEVLELFERERNSLAAIDVAQKLQYPLTSTHAILKSMQMLGYINYSAKNRTYFPSTSLPNLVNWMQDSIGGEEKLVDFLSALSATTKETINLSRRIDTQVKIIFGLESKHPFGVSVSTGTTMPVTGSLTGIVSISMLERDTRRKFIDKILANENEDANCLDHPAIEEIIATLKLNGFVLKCDVYINGIGSICFPITVPSTGEYLVVGIVGPSDRIVKHQEEYKNTIVELADKFDIQPLFPLKI